MEKFQKNLSEVTQKFIIYNMVIIFLKGQDSVHFWTTYYNIFQVEGLVEYLIDTEMLHLYSDTDLDYEALLEPNAETKREIDILKKRRDTIKEALAILNRAD